MLQKWQQSMTGIDWLEATQQVSAVCLLTQIQDNQRYTNLHQREDDYPSPDAKRK